MLRHYVVVRTCLFLKFTLSNKRYMKKILLSLAAVFVATGLMAQGQSVIYSENFDNGVPSTWTQTTNATDGGFLGGNSTSLSSQYFSFTNPGSNFVYTYVDAVTVINPTNI